MCLKISSVEWWPFCLILNVLSLGNGLVPILCQAIMSQHWLNWTFRDKRGWNMNQYKLIFIQQNVNYENVVCKIVAILFRSQWTWNLICNWFTLAVFLCASFVLLVGKCTSLKCNLRSILRTILDLSFKSHRDFFLLKFELLRRWLLWNSLQHIYCTAVACVKMLYHLMPQNYNTFF